jgi:DNA polymerase I-like protein with 3'-5' exonuclease and polymerase domains
LAVHDEIAVECAAGQVEAVTAWLRQALVDGLAGLLEPAPVAVQVHVGRSWGLK